MAVSTDFAPPFKLITPYFIIGIFTFAVSVLLLFWIDITDIFQTSAETIAWVHLFLLGFVMMVIFGAMAQLVPVVLEVGHFAVDLYYAIYPLLFVGSLMMGVGFIHSPALLPYGGVIVLIALLIFVAETFLTINKVKKLNTVMTSVVIANIFLFMGMLFGITLALGYAGEITVDLHSLLQAHVYLVLFGYVGVTIMGISMVLLPMFWLSHSFSWKPVQRALWLISLGVLSVVFSALSDIRLMAYIGYVLTLLAFLFYVYQIYIIYKTRVRIEEDIYKDSLLFSYSSFVVALLLGLVGFLSKNEHIFIAGGFLALVGFVAFLIIGHLYKIVPFLVWYQRFSPLVGKEKVPMLADMVPARSAKFGFVYNALGVSIATLAIAFVQPFLFQAGVSFLLIGSLFVFKDILYMINYK
ncbi:hypothetical protein MNB_SM-7-480 [hydrothermal vent metagenome]|uniref:Uncharacterized protein n=1 Tax=hydrothermal vent metagenome TaxID=652676 RepID=A0A1W1BU86_9ZZZZ